MHDKECKRRRERSCEPSRKRRRTSGDRDSRSRNRGKSRSLSRPRKSEYERKPNKFWDVAPTGFENTSVLDYKEKLASGQVPVPATVTGHAVLKTEIPFVGNALSRQARRLYVGNIPFGINEEALKLFFNEQLKVNGLCQTTGDPVIACQINADKNYAFLEFRSVDECTLATSFDGITCSGQVMKIRRPRDYQPLPGSTDITSVLPNGVISTQVAESPDKIFIGCIPIHVTEDQVKEILQQFGQLKSFNLVMDVGTGFSKGYAFCEYVDSSLTDSICKVLTGFDLQGKRLVVQRASVGKNPGAMLSALQIAGYNPDEVLSNKTESTRILCLINMVTKEELEDDEEFEAIEEDVRAECEQFGKVLSVKIPRPDDRIEVPGVGKIFVEFSAVEHSQTAQQSLSGRRFNGKIVVTSFFDVEKYHSEEF